MNMPGDQLVRLYSYQEQFAWDRAQNMGFWTGFPNLYDDEEDRKWKYAYEWMIARMSERVPNFSGDYPMWAWTKRPCTKPKKHRKGSIRLTVLVPRERIVFSDYDLWHGVLNQWFISETEREWDIFNKEWPHDNLDGFLDHIRPSWDRCLEFKASTSKETTEWIGPYHSCHVQACIDRFYWNEIVDVRRFY